MLLFEFLNKNPLKSRRLKLAAGAECEHCGNAFPLALLEIHVIDQTGSVGGRQYDLQKEFLVLCQECHRIFHSRPVEESLQRELVRYRPAEVRSANRHVLGIRPRTYVPPGTGDPETIFREMIERGAMDLCLNGG